MKIMLTFVHPLMLGALKNSYMLTKKSLSVKLIVPVGMNRLPTSESNLVQGGKRRPGSTSLNDSYAVIAALISPWILMAYIF